MSANANLSINKCYNDSKIDSSYSGGITGRVGLNNLKVLNCGVSSNSQIIGNKYSGGILGYHENYANNYIYNSYVLGAISGDGYVGGICGNSISGPHNGHEVETKLENIYFAGTLEGGTKTGGIIGACTGYDAEKLSLTNCFYINTITKGISNVDRTDIIAKSKAYMQGQDFVNDLNRYISTYQGELEFSGWKYNAGGYPTH